MEKHQFNWISDVTNESNKQVTHLESEQRQPSLKEKAFLTINEYKVPIIIALILALLSFGTNSKPIEEKTKSYSAPPLQAYVSMWPIAKGEKLEPLYLKSIQIKAKGLTRNQQLQLFEVPSLGTSTQDFLVAKKDIPPNKPIFWTDLKIKRTIAPNQTKIRIHYGEEN